MKRRWLDWLTPRGWAFVIWTLTALFAVAFMVCGVRA